MKKREKKIISVLESKKATQKDVLNIIEIFKQNGSVDFSQYKLKDFSEKAKKCLISLKNSESKEILKELAEYSVTRCY